MPSVLESLTSLLGQGDTLTKLGSLIDGDTDQAGTALEAAGPALIGGIADRASGDGGADLITEQLDATDPAMLDDVDGFLDAGDSEAGTGILDNIFGEDRDGLLDGLAEHSGLAKEAFTKLLPMLAPLVMSTLAKLRSDDDLDADGVVGLLSGEKESLESDGKLGDWFGKLAAGGALGALGAAAAGAAGKLGDAKDAAVDAVSDAKDEATEALGDAKDSAKDAAARRETRRRRQGRSGDAKDAAVDAKER